MIKPKQAIYKLKVPIYSHDLYLVLAPSLIDGYKLLPKKLQKACPVPDGNEAQAVTYNDRDGTSAILLVNQGPNPTHAQVAHEISHVVGCIFDRIKAKVRWGDEVGCYLCDYLTEWVYRRLAVKSPGR